MPYCQTCKKIFHSLGIARHRSAHRDRNEKCTIEYSNGETYTHNFDKRAEPQEKDLKILEPELLQV